MEKNFTQFGLQKSGDKISFVASDETLDRAGEVIPIESWDLTNFMKNPVMLVNHDYTVESIVGLWKNIRIEGKKLLMDPVFHGITELSKAVEEMVSTGILSTVSVGFIPHGPVKDGDIVRNELLETSLVAVPANPNAERIKTLALEVKDEEKAKVKSWVEAEEKSVKTEKDKAHDEQVIMQATLNEQLEEITELKEGRVLSGKNRKLIESAVSNLKQLGDLLSEVSGQFEQLLEASDTGKGAEQSREPKVDTPPSKSTRKVDSNVRRALQDMNRISNRVLRDLKP